MLIDWYIILIGFSCQNSVYIFIHSDCQVIFFFFFYIIFKCGPKLLSQILACGSSYKPQSTVYKENLS